MSMIAPVSVVIPCCSCCKTISRAVNSVLSQTLLPFELILVDNASDDGGEAKAELSRIKDSIEI